MRESESHSVMSDSLQPHEPGSSVHGILQARIVEWVAMPSSRGYFWPRDQTCVTQVSCIGRQVLYHLVPPGKPLKSQPDLLKLTRVRITWGPGHLVHLISFYYKGVSVLEAFSFTVTLLQYVSQNDLDSTL